MAVELPTSRYVVAAGLYGRKRPILSGDDSNDERYGFRGLAAAQNHIWAYKTRVICSVWDHADGFVFNNSTSSGQQNMTYKIPWQWGKGVKTAQLDAWIKNGQVYLTADVNGTPATSSVSTLIGGTTTQVTVTVNLASTVGGYGYVEVDYDQNGSFECYGFEISEVVLASGDIT